MSCLEISSIPGGVRVRGTDPNISMDDVADAMWEGFLRSEAKMRERGRSHFNKPEEEPVSNEAAGERILTFGEKAVGLTFNPSGDTNVAALKQAFATIIDHCNDKRESTQSSEAKRLWSIAITEAQGAQMWAVKAQTWED